MGNVGVVSTSPVSGGGGGSADGGREAAEEGMADTKSVRSGHFLVLVVVVSNAWDSEIRSRACVWPVCTNTSPA